MLTALIFIVLAVTTLVPILPAVLVGIRQEPRTANLSHVASGPITALVRQLTGLSVRRPIPTTDSAGGQGDSNAAWQASRPKATAWPHDERR